MKKFLAIVLALVMVVALAAPACAAGDKTVKVWVAENVVGFTKDVIADFQAANPEFADFEVIVEPVGEGDAASNVLTDLDASADIFGFPQDQLARLVAAGALVELEDSVAEKVAAENDAGSVAAATMAGLMYAYPMTSDNGYFLYYDKSVISDPGSLAAIIADCTLTYDADDSGAFTACNIDYASEAGLGALKAMIALHKSPAFNNGSSVSNATNAAAVVDGTWDAGAAKELFGENYACAKLPTFNCNGVETQLSGFGGFKLLGVKPQTDDDKLAFCDALAYFLASGEIQLGRFNAVGWGPSNLEAKASEAVQADEALSALGEQLAFDIPQGQYPGDYWSLATALGDSVKAGELDNADDAALMEVLQKFQETCISYAK